MVRDSHLMDTKISDTSEVSATTISVDYNDVDSMAKVLADNKVHTIISALRVFDAPTSEAEVNLVRATVQAGNPKRFIASVWGIQYSKTSTVGQARERTLVELRRTKLDWTRFNNGFFLDYYGPPSLKSYMTRVAFAIDVANKKAGIPGTGDEPMTFTHTFDVAKFVVAALDLPEWDEIMYCYGEKISWNEFLKLAEETRFNVAYDPPEKLQKGEITELPLNVGTVDFPKEVLQGLMALWGLYVLEGKFDIPTDKALNKVFPDVQPLKVRDVLGMWRGQ
ncbi:hypothetical protein RRF57_007905 [Xylaria bambusicola]|uniref:NmrA-like domain-containing protein n=1 Tax=Xylaria bambusicola TaxID=326684 RepID=A0AAN7UST7_9PEZI